MCANECWFDPRMTQTKTKKKISVAFPQRGQICNNGPNFNIVITKKVTTTTTTTTTTIHQY
jgi:hypothetical protein